MVDPGGGVVQQIQIKEDLGIGLCPEKSWKILYGQLESQNLQTFIFALQMRAITDTIVVETLNQSAKKCEL